MNSNTKSKANKAKSTKSISKKISNATSTLKLVALPLSKEVVRYSRMEAYIVTIIFFVYIFLDKDVSAITDLIKYSWIGYNGIKGLYIWLAKSEHVYDRKIDMLKISKDLGIDSDKIDDIMDTVEEETEKFNEENTDI